MDNSAELVDSDDVPVEGRQWSLLWIVPYVGGYLTLVAWFKYVDVYHAHFSANGPLVALYNCLRIAFIFYLFWLIHVVGSIALRLLGSPQSFKGNALDTLIVRFFAGTAVWHLAMLALGFLNLYQPWIAAAMTIPLICLSYVDLRVAVARLDEERTFASWMSVLRGTNGIWDRATAIGLGGLLVVAFVALLLVKGLYPAGGHDYFMHYFPYMRSVIAHGGLWPNEVWYHFYYSKGAGLYFLAMLLTDPLAPQLVTFCFVAAASIALHRLLSRLAPDSWWPLVGVILWLALYIYTPGTGIYKSNGGWADFEKLHELNASLVVGMLWLLTGALEHRCRTWWLAAGSAVIAAIILNITMAVYLGLVFSALAAWMLWRRRWADFAGCFALASLSGAVLLGILLLNYTVTGLVNDQGILLFWQYVDVEKLYRLTTLPWVINLYHSTVRLGANSVPLDRQTLIFVLQSLRLDLLYPLVGMAALVCAVPYVRRGIRFEVLDPVILLVAAIAAYLLLAVAVGRAQPISFYRYSSFTTSICIAGGVALWGAQRRFVSGPLHLVQRSVLPALVLWGCFMTALGSYQTGAFRVILGNAWRFARGSESIDAAYSLQAGWPGRLPWGAIYPGARGAYAVVGPHVPIWSMHMHSYCMLPDCQVETHSAFTIGKDWDRLMFGSPEEGRQELQEAGLNYFLFSRELSEKFGIVDTLPRSPLFAPDNIGRYLGIRWTDGDTVLLTWAGPNTAPLEQAWLADYKSAVVGSHTVGALPYDILKGIYQDLRATPHPWRSFKLPW